MNFFTKSIFGLIIVWHAIFLNQGYADLSEELDPKVKTFTVSNFYKIKKQHRNQNLSLAGELLVEYGCMINQENLSLLNDLVRTAESPTELVHSIERNLYCSDIGDTDVMEDLELCERYFARDSKECTIFSGLMRSLDLEDVYIAYVHPSLSTPMSYLGHNFLVFKKKGSWYFSKVFGFSAIIPDGISFQDLLFKGAVGGLDGKFTFSNYYEFIRQYNDVEQRDIDLYKIDLNYEEKIDLLARSISTHPVISKYDYFSRNCSSELIKFAFPKEESIHLEVQYKQPSLYIDKLIKRGLVHPVPIKFNSGLSRSFHAYQELSYSQKVQIKKVINGNESLKEVEPPLTERQKFILSEMATVSFLHLKSPVDNYRALKELEFKGDLGFRDDTSSKKIIPPNSLKLINRNDDGDITHLISYSPGFVERNESYWSANSESTLKLFNFVFSINEEREGRVNLDRIDLIKLESYRKRFSVYYPASWAFSLSINDIKERSILSLDAGYGISIGSLRSLYSFIPSIACELNYSACNAYVVNSFSHWAGDLNVSFFFRTDTEFTINSYYGREFFILRYPVGNVSIILANSLDRKLTEFSIQFQF